MTQDVFINFATQDRALVDKLDYALGSLGLTVCFDHRHFATRDRREIIDQTADDSMAVLTVWSPASVEDPDVIQQADRAGDRLVQVLAARCERPADFDHERAIRLSTWNGELDHPHFRRLLDHLDEMTLVSNSAKRSIARARGQRPDFVALLRMVLVDAARSGGGPFTGEQLVELLKAAGPKFRVYFSKIDQEALMGGLCAINAQNRYWSEPPLMALLDTTADYSETACVRDQFLPPGISKEIALVLHAEFLRRVRTHDWCLDD